MDTEGMIFGAAVGLVLLVGIAWWSFVGYVAYRILTHFGIL